MVEIRQIENLRIRILMSDLDICDTVTVKYGNKKEKTGVMKSGIGTKDRVKRRLETLRN
jgi:hypothetical protein